ncbi:hypothetical protein [Methylobacterium sp. D54C]
MPDRHKIDERLLQAHKSLFGSSADQRRAMMSALVELDLGGGLDDRQKDELALVRILATQMDGRHGDALKILDRFTPSSDSAARLAGRLRLVSVGALGLDGNVREPDPAGEPPETLGYLLLERGNAAFHGGDITRAAELWKAALGRLEENGEERGRASAAGNLGMLLVSGEDPGEREQGLAMINMAIAIKYAHDDAAGIATDCINLARSFLRRWRLFERAIAYSQQSVFFARASGDQQVLAQAHHERGLVRLAMGQLKEGRADARACIEIATKLGDSKLGRDGRSLLVSAEQLGRQGLGVGPRGQCRCGSGRAYLDCCGRADHEPIEVGLLMPSHAFELDADATAPQARGTRPILLDLQMRGGAGTRFRKGWTRVTRRKGWFELGEMPDMASQHLLAARRLIELVPGYGVQSGVVDLDVPIAACILAVCAVEAFANSVASLVNEGMREGEIPSATVPQSLATDPAEFVRGTELRLKWRHLEQVLCSPERMNDKLAARFDKLVTIRNELVHFKTLGFETVAPPPSRHHPLLAMAAGEFEIRDAPRSWPVRLLTPDFGRWCVDVAGNLIDDFRARYGARFGVPD